jgi:hypothetical protein
MSASFDDGSPTGYDTAQICLNGHCITDSSIDNPERNEDFCSLCGQPTITACKKCATPIRGYLRDSYPTPYLIPSFCYKCGAAYPWTETKISVANEMTRELDQLSEEEKKQLASSLDDLVRESPKTTLAANRFKKLMTKAGAVAAESFKKVLVDVVSETAKKILWPDLK